MYLVTYYLKWILAVRQQFWFKAIAVRVNINQLSIFTIFKCLQIKRKNKSWGFEQLLVMEEGKLTTLVVWLKSPSQMIISSIKPLKWYLIDLINMLGKHTNLLKSILKHWQNQGLKKHFDAMKPFLDQKTFKLPSLHQTQNYSKHHLVFVFVTCVFWTVVLITFSKNIAIVAQLKSISLRSQMLKTLDRNGDMQYKRITMILLYQTQFVP